MSCWQLLGGGSRGEGEDANGGGGESMPVVKKETGLGARVSPPS